MLKSFGTSVRIGIGETVVSMQRTKQRWPWSAAVRDEMALEFDPLPAAELPSRLRQALFRLIDDADIRGMPARVVLADCWVRYWTVTPPVNLASLEDCRIAAAARFAALYGESVTGWRISIDSKIDEPFLSCALPEWLHQLLMEAAFERNLVLVEIVPLLVANWNAWRAKLKCDDWLAVLHGDRISYAIAGNHGIVAAGSAGLSAEIRSRQAGLRDVLLREALRMDRSMPDGIKLCGDVPSHWVMQVEHGFAFEKVDRYEPIVGDHAAGLELLRVAAQA